MKLDPSYQIKKGRRKSIDIFKKKCQGFPQPQDLDTVGLEIPTSTNFAQILRDSNVLDDVLNIVSKKIDTRSQIIPRVRLHFVPNMGCYLQLGRNNYKIPKYETSEKIMDNYFETIFENLETLQDIAVGSLSFTNYSMEIWQQSKANVKFNDLELGKELRKVRMENQLLKLDKDKEWYKEFTSRVGMIVPWAAIEVGVSDFSMKRMSSHATMWTMRKNPGSKGKPFICSLYDSNGSASFKSTYLEKVIKILFSNSDNIDCYVIHLPRINTSDTAVMEEKFIELGIQKSITMNGYCSTLTLLLMMDIFCTDQQVYKEGHFERLLNDLQKRKSDEPIDEKHKFATAIYGKHLAYFVILMCIQHYKKQQIKPKWWSGFENQLGSWDSFEDIETVKIKRSVRFGVTKYKNMNENYDTTF